MPNQITVYPANTHTDLLPVEVAVWFLGRMTVTHGDWVLTVGKDIKAVLAAHILARGGLGINIVHGVDNLTTSEVCILSNVAI